MQHIFFAKQNLKILTRAITKQEILLSVTMALPECLPLWNYVEEMS